MTQYGHLGYQMTSYAAGFPPAHGVGFNGFSPASGYTLFKPSPAAGLGFVPGTHTGTTGVVNITSLVTICLTSDNYLFWQARVRPLVRSNLLMGYVDCSIMCPQTHTMVDHGDVAVPQSNPAYQH
jgi:hypothetical protein